MIAREFFAPTPPDPDRVAPTAALLALPSWLPANQGIRPVQLTGSASDDRGLSTVSFSVTDEYGEQQPNIDPVDLGGQASSTWARQVSLDTTLHAGDRARVYTVTATISDLAGNLTTASTDVVVWQGFRWRS